MCGARAFLTIVPVTFVVAVPTTLAADSGLPDAAAAAACTRPAARSAVRHSSFGAAIRKKLPGNVKYGAGPLLGHSIWKLRCADLTGDGRDEMVVALACCTVSTPTPWAIFRRGRGKWHTAFKRVSRKTTLADLRIDAARDVVEKLPVYEPGDALCCPSGYSYRVTHWSGSRFVAAPQPASASAR